MPNRQLTYEDLFEGIFSKKIADLRYGEFEPAINLLLKLREQHIKKIGVPALPFVPRVDVSNFKFLSRLVPDGKKFRDENRKAEIGLIDKIISVLAGRARSLRVEMSAETNSRVDDILPAGTIPDLPVTYGFPDDLSQWRNEVSEPSLGPIVVQEHSYDSFRSGYIRNEQILPQNAHFVPVAEMPLVDPAARQLPIQAGAYSQSKLFSGVPSVSPEPRAADTINPNVVQVEAQTVRTEDFIYEPPAPSVTAPDRPAGFIQTDSEGKVIAAETFMPPDGAATSSQSSDTWTKVMSIHSHQPNDVLGNVVKGPVVSAWNLQQNSNAQQKQDVLDTSTSIPPPPTAIPNPTRGQ